MSPYLMHSHIGLMQSLHEKLMLMVKKYFFNGSKIELLNIDDSYKDELLYKVSTILQRLIYRTDDIKINLKKENLL